MKEYEKNPKSMKSFCSIKRSIIQGIVRDIKTLSEELDDEIRPFVYQISDIGCSSLNLIA